MAEIALGKARTGVVERFDDEAGLGEVATGDAERFPFHCTAIADGTRHIEVGATVAFRLATAHRGAIEATDLVGLS